MARGLALLLLALLLVPACGDEDADPARGRAAEPAAPHDPTDAVPVEATRALQPDATDTAALDPRRAERLALVKRHVEGRGVGDPHVLRAMRTVPRHRFVPEALRAAAYENRPLPIGHDQTISQPYIVASMTEEALVGETSRVLEIGTGSGYQAAVLAEITPHVFSIEIKAPLAERAKRTLRELGYDRVAVRHADGYFGWPEEAPFDAIIVTAAAPHVPPPLVRQLKPGGRMVIPVGAPFAIQDLVLVEKDDDGTVYTRSLYAVRFVPLTGTRESQAQGD